MEYMNDGYMINGLDGAACEARKSLGIDVERKKVFWSCPWSISEAFDIPEMLQHDGISI